MTPTDATSPRRFPVALTVVTLIAMAVLIGLGVWQLKRLAWKTDLLAHVSALQGAKPVLLGPVLNAQAQGRDVGFTRVTVACPGLGAAPFLQLYGLKDGQPGSRLISACEIQSAAYRTILVDRGFVAAEISARPPVDRADTTPLQMVGVLRNPDAATFVTPPNELAANRWYSRDAVGMAKALGVAAPAPVFLMAETSSNPDWAALSPAPLPAEIPNRHLEYALTWFGLAAALAGVYAAVLFRRLKA